MCTVSTVGQCGILQVLYLITFSTVHKDIDGLYCVCCWPLWNTAGTVLDHF
jgi:hypothetical protein